MIRPGGPSFEIVRAAIFGASRASHRSRLLQSTKSKQIKVQCDSITTCAKNKGIKPKYIYN